MRIDPAQRTDEQISRQMHQRLKRLRREHPGWSEREVWQLCFFRAPAPLRRRVDELLASGKMKKRPRREGRGETEKPKEVK